LFLIFHLFLLKRISHLFLLKRIAPSRGQPTGGGVFSTECSRGYDWDYSAVVCDGQHLIAYFVLSSYRKSVISPTSSRKSERCFRSDSRSKCDGCTTLPPPKGSRLLQHKSQSAANFSFLIFRDCVVEQGGD
jgi:hypothetical protein